MRHFDTMDNLTEQIAMSRPMIGATISQIEREEIGGAGQSRATISHRPSLSQEVSLVLGFMLQPNLPGSQIYLHRSPFTSSGPVQQTVQIAARFAIAI